MAAKNPARPADPDPQRDRLLLLDGHSLAYRAFFALPAENFSTTTGQPTNAVYGFTAMLINVLRDEKPTHVIAAFDKGMPAERVALSELPSKSHATKNVAGATNIEVPSMVVGGRTANATSFTKE